MSKQGLARAIGLASLDKPFRTRLFRNPATAVNGTDIKLDGKEVSFLKEGGTHYLIEDIAKSMGIKYTGGGKCR